MAKTTRKYRYRKNNYFRRYRQLASRNYFKVKAEFYDRIIFPNGSTGQPVFVSKEADGTLANRSVLTTTNIFTGYSYAQVLSGLFSYYKILSVAIELIPKYNTGDTIANGRTVFLGFKMGSNDALTIQEIKALNQNLVLDPRNRQRRYWKVYNTQGLWNPTDAISNGCITIQADDVGTKDTQHQWDIKVTLYLLYKYSKA